MSSINNPTTIETPNQTEEFPSLDPARRKDARNKSGKAATDVNVEVNGNKITDTLEVLCRIINLNLRNEALEIDQITDAQLREHLRGHLRGIITERLGVSLDLNEATTVYQGSGVHIDSKSTHKVVEVREKIEGKGTKDVAIMDWKISEIQDNLGFLEQSIREAYLQTLERSPKSKASLSEGISGADNVQTSIDVIRSFEENKHKILSQWKKEVSSEGHEFTEVHLRNATRTLSNTDLFKYYTSRVFSDRPHLAELTRFIWEEGKTLISPDEAKEALDLLRRACIKDPQLVEEWKKENKNKKYPSLNNLTSLASQKFQGPNKRKQQDYFNIMAKNIMKLIDHGQSPDEQSIYFDLVMPDALIETEGTEEDRNTRREFTGAVEVKGYHNNDLESAIRQINQPDSILTEPILLRWDTTKQARMINLLNRLHDLDYAPANGHLMVLRLPEGLNQDLIKQLGDALTSTTITDYPNNPHIEIETTNLQTNLVIQQIPFNLEEISTIGCLILKNHLESMVDKIPADKRDKVFNRIFAQLRVLKDQKYWGIKGKNDEDTPENLTIINENRDF
jgi:hypothetical protein